MIAFVIFAMISSREKVNANLFEIVDIRSLFR